jgi:hypothetical protein
MAGVPAHPPQMVISDGDVGGLLALRAAADRAEGTVLVWPMGGAQVESGARLKAARQQAELVGARLYGPAGGPELEPLVELAAAAVAAAEAGCALAVWPVSAGESNRGPEALARIEASVARAGHLSRLVAIDYPGFELGAPYADLSDRQLADLILDMDLPIWTCWWYAGREAGDPVLPLADAAREHWAAMLGAAGWRGPLPGPGARVGAGTH